MKTDYTAIKKTVKETVREFVPDIPVLRKAITKHQLNTYGAVSIPLRDVVQAESDYKIKAAVIQKCARKWPNIFSKTEKSISHILEYASCYSGVNAGQKEMLQTDMIFCRFAYGFIPSEYLTYCMEGRTMEERQTFISEKDHICFSFMMNDIFEWQLFNDKMKTYQRFQPYYHREVISVNAKADFHRFQEFANKHPVFVKKNVFESCGHSIEKIDLQQDSRTLQELFDSFIASGKTILEECVMQAPETEVFNASSVNTIRCITFYTKHGVIAPYCFMKVGRKGSFVDNGGSGGILVGIDEKTGVLNSDGIDEMRNVYKVHPDSGVAFKGYQLPEFNKMIQICIEMSAQIPKVKYIGWDMAYTKDKQWVVIEGNGLSQFFGPQSTMQRGIKKEVETIMQDMELMV